MNNQLILATNRITYGNKYNFQFNSCLTTKSEIALHSIHYPKFVIPKCYKLFFKVNFLTETIDKSKWTKSSFLDMDPYVFHYSDQIHVIKIDFDDYPINSGDDLILLIYNNFVRYFKEKYPHMIEKWKEMGPGIHFQGTFPISLYGEGIIFDLDKLYIEILDTDYKLEQIKDNLKYLSPYSSGIGDIIKRENIFNLIKNSYEIEFNEKLSDISGMPVTHILRMPNGKFQKVDPIGRSVETAYVICNIIEPSHRNVGKERILDVVTLNGKHFSNVYEIKNLTFHKISRDSIFDLSIEIKGVTGENISFNDEAPLIFKFILQ